MRWLFENPVVSNLKKQITTLKKENELLVKENEILQKDILILQTLSPSPEAKQFIPSKYAVNKYE